MHPVLMIIHSVPHHLWYLEKMENTLCQPQGYTGLLRKQAFKKTSREAGRFFLSFFGRQGSVFHCSCSGIVFQ